MSKLYETDGIKLSKGDYLDTKKKNVMPAQRKDPTETFEQKINVNIPVKDMEKIQMFWAVLGVIFPLAGIALYFVWKNKKPAAAKYAIFGGLIGLALNFVTMFL